MCLQERPYHNDSTASRLLSEVKHCRARLVLRWGTTLESLVLFFCFFCFSLVSKTRVPGSIPNQLFLFSIHAMNTCLPFLFTHSSQHLLTYYFISFDVILFFAPFHPSQLSTS